MAYRSTSWDRNKEAQVSLCILVCNKKLIIDQRKQTTMEYTTYIAMLGYLFLLLGAILASIGVGGTGNEIIATMMGWIITIPIALYGMECVIKGNCTSYAIVVSYITVAVGFFSLLAGLYLVAVGPERPHFAKHGSYWWNPRYGQGHYHNGSYHRHYNHGGIVKETVEVRKYPYEGD